MKAKYLLTKGMVTQGTLKSKKPTNTSINKQRVYKLTFEFMTEDGRHFDVVSKIHETGLLEDDACERLLYDPSNPAYAIMLDNLPGSPDFDETGQIKPLPIRSTILVLIPPVMAVVITLAVGVLCT
ncbi:MAG: hypothetical protein JXB88_05570 [Spirochaetales bacterium]|nr:hypothetical protein [Spirochaetales bacterium]